MHVEGGSTQAGAIWDGTERRTVFPGASSLDEGEGGGSATAEGGAGGGALIDVDSSATAGPGGASCAFCRWQRLVPSPKHNYPDRNSELTEIYDFEIGSA